MSDTGASGVARQTTFSLTRTFDAPRDAVFRAWTDPEQLARWWGGAGAVTSPESTTVDLRPGGEWHATIRVEADGSEHPFSGVYREIAPPERLVMTLTDAPEPDPEREHLVTVVLTDADGRTVMEFTQTGDFGEAPEQALQQLEHGYGGFFAQLAEVVEQRE